MMTTKITQSEPIGIKPIEFCIKCGASFPPREGEGICIEWKECYRKQAEGKI